MPFWLLFFKHIERLQNAHDIFLITVKLAAFYIAYCGCVIIDNIFIGLGKTAYNAINSLIINVMFWHILYLV